MHIKGNLENMKKKGKIYMLTLLEKSIDSWGLRACWDLRDHLSQNLVL